MITNLTPINAIEKTSKNGSKFWVFSTREGQTYSVFEIDVMNYLEQNYNKTVTCETATSADGKYHNIGRTAQESVNSVVNAPAATPQETEGLKPKTTSGYQQSGGSNGYAPKEATMLMSYTKDIFIANLAQVNKDLPEGLKGIANEVLKTYKAIRDSL